MVISPPPDRIPCYYYFIVNMSKNTLSVWTSYSIQSFQSIYIDSEILVG